MNFTKGFLYFLSRPKIWIDYKSVNSLGVNAKEEKVAARRIRYSEWFKRPIVAEYEKGILNKNALQVKYRIGGNSRILEWCYKYGRFHYPDAKCLLTGPYEGSTKAT